MARNPKTIKLAVGDSLFAMVLAFSDWRFAVAFAFGYMVDWIIGRD